MKTILLIDHYDSFTYTISDYFQQLKMCTTVIAYDDPILLNIKELNPSGIVLSPGPGHPRDVPQTIELIKNFYLFYPMLGICLGMQCMAYAFGGQVIHASEVMHGKQSFIYHTGSALYQNISSPHQVTRYHSLMVDEKTLPESFKVNSWVITDSNQRILMGMEHHHYPLFGVQYHPEAILSEFGLVLFQNFLTQAMLANWQ